MPTDQTEVADPPDFHAHWQGAWEKDRVRNLVIPWPVASQHPMPQHRCADLFEEDRETPMLTRELISHLRCSRAQVLPRDADKKYVLQLQPRPRHHNFVTCAQGNVAVPVHILEFPPSQ